MADTELFLVLKIKLGLGKIMKLLNSYTTIGKLLNLLAFVFLFVKVKELNQANFFPYFFFFFYALEHVF